MKLQGHLFDKGVFNKVLDILQSNKTNFKVMEWKIGQNHKQLSWVSIQVQAEKEGSTMQKALDQVFELGEEHDIEVTTGEVDEKQKKKAIFSKDAYDSS